jgi:hypothetical protein
VSDCTELERNLKELEAAVLGYFEGTDTLRLPDDWLAPSLLRIKRYFEFYAWKGT